MTDVARPIYPRELEIWWLETARKKLDVPVSAAALDILESDVAKLSDGFTTDRAAGFGDYAADKNMLLAYGLFFFPQTFVRTLFQFDEIVHRCGWRAPSGRAAKIADLGSGSGSAGFALASRLAKNSEVELTAIESSSASLAFAQSIAREHFPNVKFQTRNESLLGFAEGTYDIIIASFSLNECFHNKTDAEFDAWTDRVFARLSDGGLLLISEPALKSSSERLERLRDRISAAGKFSVLAPCLHHRACPLRAAKGETFCHEVRSWKPPSSLQKLNSKLFRAVHLLKYSFVAIAKCPPKPAEISAERARLVSPMMNLKGRVQADGCAADGAIRRYEMLTRKFETADKHAFLKTERGDIVRWKNLSLLGDKQTHRAEGAAREFGFS